jgi:hypothetical protein
VNDIGGAYLHWPMLALHLYPETEQFMPQLGNDCRIATFVPGVH